jgi:hypothetical protein
MKQLSFLPMQTIISILTINVKKTILIWALCFASSSFSLQPADAQIAPAPAASQLAPPPAPSSAAPSGVVHNTSTHVSHPGPIPAPASAAPQDSDETKVVRIYRGTGYFDQAMAEKLRPNLAKAFAPAKSAALPAVPVAAIAAGSVPVAPKPAKSDHL